MKQEIERKYAVEYLPEDFKTGKIMDIEQNVIYRDMNTMIRVRKIQEENKTSYIYTLKTKGDIQYNNNYDVARKYEIENEITEEQYENLKQRKISNTVNKIRILVPIHGNLTVEIDVYKDYLEGLLTAEIEFPTQEDAKTFEKPDWLGDELGYKELSNRKLAEMTREEWQSKVTKEFIENNRKVINQLKDNYNI